jgi:hypothetical protein
MDIDNYYFKNQGAWINYYDEYYDFNLSSDNESNIFNYITKCSGNGNIINDKLVLWLDINNTGTTIDGTSLKSLVEWNNKIIEPKSGLTIFNVGLTGIDNGFTNDLTGFTINYNTGDTKVILYPISSYTLSESGATSGKFEYPYLFLNNNTTTGYCGNICDVGDLICLDGGFYQGVLKLDFTKPSPITISSNTDSDYCNDKNQKIISNYKDERKYEIFPTKLDDGWSVETWIKIKNDKCDDEFSGLTLNDIYENNKGFFFYIGTRAENKFKTFFSGQTDYKTHLDLDLNPISVKTYNDGWDFLNNRIPGIGGNSCLCCDENKNNQITVNEYCDELSENVLGFRITPDYRIGYRKITVTGECQNNKYFFTDSTIEENYSEPYTVLTGNTWLHIVITYTNTGDIVRNLEAGKLKFFINGLNVLTINNFINLKLRELNEYSEKQELVPYNISWGGGSQGLLETQTFGGYNPNNLGLMIENNFAGTFNGYLSELRFYEKPLNILEIRNNFFYDCGRYCKITTFGGDINIETNNFNNCSSCNPIC